MAHETQSQLKVTNVSVQVRKQLQRSALLCTILLLEPPLLLMKRYQMLTQLIRQLLKKLLQQLKALLAPQTLMHSLAYGRRASQVALLNSATCTHVSALSGLHVDKCLYSHAADHSSCCCSVNSCCTIVALTLLVLLPKTTAQSNLHVHFRVHKSSCSLLRPCDSMLATS